ncbi:MAG: DNA-directed RNA polymerase subunit alpha [Candidatus Dormibacteria bacterium]
MIEVPEPEVKVLEEDDRHGYFQVEPLEPGFGTTLGNSLRRVLLSYLDGAAVISVAIEGVQHEFTSVPYIKEDVTELILNLKQINIRSHSADPVRVYLDVRGPKEVTAGDIEVSSDVEIVNPDLYLGTITSKEGRLRCELTVERGKGYSPADRNKREGQAIGVIPIDAIFSPVHRANFTVEKTRVGQATDYDRLLIDLWTDGTIKPREAINQAASILGRHLDLFSAFGSGTAPAHAAGGASAKSTGPTISIDELDLSVRAINCLKANEILSVAELKKKRGEELLSLRNFGRKSLDEIYDRLIERGYATPEELASWK